MERPLDWAATQNDLALALGAGETRTAGSTNRRRPAGPPGKNQRTVPLDWAATSNLGNALSSWVSADGTAHEAVTAIARRCRKERGRAPSTGRDPEQLGTVLDAGQREGTRAV